MPKNAPVKGSTKLKHDPPPLARGGEAGNNSLIQKSAQLREHRPRIGRRDRLDYLHNPPHDLGQ